MFPFITFYLTNLIKNFNRDKSQKNNVFRNYSEDSVIQLIWSELFSFLSVSTCRTDVSKEKKKKNNEKCYPVSSIISYRIRELIFLVELRLVLSWKTTFVFGYWSSTINNYRKFRPASNSTFQSFSMDLRLEIAIVFIYSS